MKFSIILVLGLIAVSSAPASAADPIKSLADAKALATSVLNNFNSQVSEAINQVAASLNALVNDAKTQRQTLSGEAKSILDNIISTVTNFQKTASSEISNLVSSIRSVIANFNPAAGIACFKNTTAFNIVVNNFNSTVFNHWSVYRNNVSTTINESTAYLSAWRNTTIACKQQPNSTLALNCLKTQVKFLQGNVTVLINKAQSIRNSAYATATNDFKTLTSNLKTCSV